MKSSFVEAGIDTTNRLITNHSGKVRCCTKLLNDGFSDKMVWSRSGHRSDAVNIYKQSLTELEISVSNSLNAPDVDKKQNIEQKTVVKENISKNHDHKTLKLSVPSEISKIMIEKDGKEIVVSMWQITMETN